MVVSYLVALPEWTLTPTMMRFAVWIVHRRNWAREGCGFAYRLDRTEGVSYEAVGCSPSARGGTIGGVWEEQWRPHRRAQANPAGGCLVTLPATLSRFGPRKGRIMVEEVWGVYHEIAGLAEHLRLNYRENTARMRQSRVNLDFMRQAGVWSGRKTACGRGI